MKKNYHAMVSVVMTNYNYEHFLGEAIDSLLKQTLENWELIVVDDGSKDNSIEKINSYVEKYPNKISLYTHPGNVNQKIKASYELGFEQVRGKYLAFLESDDKWDEDFLKEKVGVLEKYPEASLAYSDIELFGDEKTIGAKYSDYMKYIRYAGKPELQPFEALNLILMRNPVATFSNMLTRSEYLDFICLKKEHDAWLDWWLLIHLAVKGKFVYIDKKLTKWRIHNESNHYKFMDKEDMKKREDAFKIDALSLIKNYYLNSGKPEKWYDIEKYVNSFRSSLFNFRHNLGFALNSPMAVFRKLFPS